MPLRRLFIPLLPLTTLQLQLLRGTAEHEPLQPAAIADLAVRDRQWTTARRKKAEEEIEQLIQRGYLTYYCEGDLITTERARARLDPRSTRNIFIYFLAWLITATTAGVIAAIASDLIRLT